MFIGRNANAVKSLWGNEARAGKPHPDRTRKMAHRRFKTYYD